VHDPRSPCEGSQGAVHPVIPLEILREPLVDRVQINDEEATHKSIMAHHDGTRRAIRGRTCHHTGAAHYFKHAFKGRLTRADTDRRCTIPRGLAQKERGPCTFRKSG
jgi:hypothetical protein